MENNGIERQVVVRTLLNLLISAVDFFPVVGLISPAAANLAKMARRYDLTPDVPKTVAYPLFGVDLVATPLIAGILPMYAVQTIWQLKKDWPVLRQILGRIRRK